MSRVQLLRASTTSLVRFTGGEAPANSHQNLEKARAAIAANGYCGEMSARTAAKVRRYIRGWFTRAKVEAGSILQSDAAIAKRFCFVTLTLPSYQFHTDQEIRRQALTPFLQQLKRLYNADSYLWKAEPQANGNIHFHILFDVFIDWQVIRSLWNGYMDAMGYIERYRQERIKYHNGSFVVRGGPGVTQTTEQQYKAYRQGVATNWSNPNSTDVHVLRKAKNVFAYITSYISKKANRRKIEGRIWGCSDDLRELEAFEIVDTPDVSTALAHCAQNHKLKRSGDEHVEIWTGDIMQFLQEELPALYQDFVSYWQKKAGRVSMSVSAVTSCDSNDFARCQFT